MGNLSWQNAAVLLLPLWVLAAGCGDDAVSMAQFATNWNAPQPAASFYPASPTHGFNSHEVVDWDADGDLDLFLGSAHGDSVGLFLHPNLPGGIQSTPASFMAGGIYAISTIDWDGDGRPEVAVGRTNPMKVELYDDDIFGNQYSLHTIPGGKTTQLAWVDHDGDNTPDLSVLRETDSASALASAVYLDLTTPQGTQPIGGIVSLPTSSDVPQFTVHSWVDLDGYGDHELVTCGRNLADTFSWLYVWEYDSVTETWLQLDQMHIGDGDCRALAWADYDDDGDFDLAVAMAGSKNLLLRNTSGLPPLELACFLGDDDGSNDLGWGDWDADGLPDLVLFHKDGEGAAVWGNGVLRSCQPGGVMGEPATVSFPALGTEAAALSLADIDGDARIEIVVVPTEPGFAAMIVNNEARPPLGAGPPASSGDDGQAVAMVWADFSDDATEELVVVTSNGRLLIYAASPTGLSLLATHELSGGISPSTLALADWNNDGTMDALIGTGAGTPDRLLQVDSNGNMQTVWQSEPSNTSDALWVDLDLDGDLDLLRSTKYVACSSMRATWPSTMGPSAPTRTTPISPSCLRTSYCSPSRT